MKNNKQQGSEIIKSLSTGKFFCECPCGCEEEINLKDAGLFYLNDLTPEALNAKKAMLEDMKDQRQELKDMKKNMTTRTQLTTRSVNLGFILERLAPSLSTFRFSHNDCRSLFDPIDYVIFEGLSEKGSVSKIIFTDIKSGGARLKSTQKEIKALVQDKKVDFKAY